MTRLTIGLSANAAGAHTAELLAGVEYAQDWLGVRCRTVWAEDGRDPVVARRAADQLVSAGLALVIGHLSAAASVHAADVYRRTDTALLAPGTSHPDLNPRNWPGILRSCGRDERTARAMVAALPGDGPTLVVCQRQTFGLSLGAALCDALAAEGVRVEPRVVDDPAACTPDPGTSRIFAAGIHEFCAELVGVLRRSAPDGRIAVGDDCLTSNFLTLGGRSVEGVRVVAPIVPAARDRALEGYFATSVIATVVGIQALVAAPRLRGAGLGRLIRGRSWPTPYGPVGFDGAGDLTGLREEVFTVREGSFQPAAATHAACDTS
jgi:ABC-type branched-subunit amino acid transport system substrate-binding protein